MKVSLNWLKEYVTIPDDLTPTEIGRLLTLHSVEVEKIEEQAELLKDIVVGQIGEITKHPQADKLSLVQVKIGKNKTIKVVCGGGNLRVNMLVAFAKVGAQVRWHGQGDLITLDKAVIRGETSEGMICAACEIGLGEYKAGDNTVMDFGDLINNRPVLIKTDNYLLNQDDFALGMPLADFLGINDAILEIDNKTITNRPDLWGHYGLARELAAILKTELKEVDRLCKVPKKQSVDLSVLIKEPKLCSRYQGVVIGNLKVAPSPSWLQNKLSAVGIRPINNIVDVTNYLMLELGQPLHAFDYHKLTTVKNSCQIIVRRAKTGETITTLDNAVRKLDSEMLVIADAKKPIALAGVMGGLNSAVDEQTTQIVLEAATFEPDNNRQTSTKLGLRTEAVMRYEKSLDPNLPAVALCRALDIFSALIPESVVLSKIIDKKQFKLNCGPISLSVNYVQKKVGVAITDKKINEILFSLGFGLVKTIDKKNQDVIFKVTIPTWRATKDITSAEDLVEEVARIYGFDKITPTFPIVKLSLPEINQQRRWERQVKNILISLGLNEVYNYPFLSENLVEKSGGQLTDHIKLLNSLSNDYVLLRTNLTANLIVNIKNNLRYFADFKLFEVGTVFNKQVGNYLIKKGRPEKLPKQEKILAGAVVIKELSKQKIFAQTKLIIENLLSKLKIDDYKILPQAADQSIAEIKAGQQSIGQIFILNKKIQNNFDLNPKINCGIFELNLDTLFICAKSPVLYQQLPKFPEIKIDLAIVCPKSVLWYNIEEEIRNIASGKLRQIELFDIYEAESLGVDKKSLAMHLSFGETERTMEMKEVELLREQIVEKLKTKFNAEIRG